MSDTPTNAELVVANLNDIIAELGGDGLQPAGGYTIVSRLRYARDRAAQIIESDRDRYSVIECGKHGVSDADLPTLMSLRGLVPDHPGKPVTIPRALLEGIEWEGTTEYWARCPACENREQDGHTPDCWLGLALGREG